MQHTSSSAPAVPNAGSTDFDDILTTSAGSGATLQASARPAAAPTSSSSAELHSAHLAAPTLSEFTQSWDLYRDPVLAGIFAGLVLGLAGVFVVLRRAVFVTAAISQAAGLGVACAFLFAIHTEVELPPVLIAFVFAALAALSLALRPPTGLPREATVGFVYLAASALSIIVGDRISQEAHDIASILFGSAVLVRPIDLALVAVIGAVALASLVVSARGLTFAGFDPDAARVQGLPVRTLEIALWLAVAGEVAVATRALGALPVFAFAVLPAMGALRLSRRLPQALALGSLLGAVSGGLGYLGAFLLELPVGACQATLAVVLCLGCLVVARVIRGR
jgi:zinc transport system permease protein